MAISKALLDMLLSSALLGQTNLQPQKTGSTSTIPSPGPMNNIGEATPPPKTYGPPYPLPAKPSGSGTVYGTPGQFENPSNIYGAPITNDTTGTLGNLYSLFFKGESPGSTTPINRPNAINQVGSGSIVSSEQPQQGVAPGITTGPTPTSEQLAGQEELEQSLGTTTGPSEFFAGTTQEEATQNPLLEKLAQLREQEVKDLGMLGLADAIQGQTVTRTGLRGPPPRNIPMISPAAIERQSLIEEEGLKRQFAQRDPNSEDSQFWQSVFKDLGFNFGRVTAEQAPGLVQLAKVAMVAGAPKEKPKVPSVMAERMAQGKTLIKMIDRFYQLYEKARTHPDFGPISSRWAALKGRLLGNEPEDLRRLHSAGTQIAQVKALIETGQQATDAQYERIFGVIGQYSDLPERFYAGMGEFTESAYQRVADMVNTAGELGYDVSNFELPPKPVGRKDWVLMQKAGRIKAMHPKEIERALKDGFTPYYR